MVIAVHARNSPVARVFFALALAVLFALFASAAASAQTALQAPEARVKAAFLFKFGSYIEWPAEAFASAGAPFTIGVLDADPLADELATLIVGRNMAGRPVLVRKLHDGDPVTGLNVLFIGNTDHGRLAGILAAIKGRATLAVTESAGALELGSTINFVVVDGKIRFDVALPPAEAASLKISSRLLAVARKVTGSP